MDLEFANPKHEKLVNDHGKLSRKYGQEADKILATLEALFAATTLLDLPRSYRPHLLGNNYSGHFAADVNKRYRVIFYPNKDKNPNQLCSDQKSVTHVVITEIYIDYHE